MAETIVGIFRDWESARSAIEQLHTAGFSAGDVSVVARDLERAEALRTETLDREHEGAVIGAAAGGALGAAGGLALGLGALAVPGIGPILAAGPIVALIAGLAAGAGAGGLLGTLLGAGIPDEDASFYEEALHRGEIVVAVKATGRGEEARRLLAASGAATTHRRVVEPDQGRHQEEPAVMPEESPAVVAGMAAASPGGMLSGRPTALDAPAAHTLGVLSAPGLPGAGVAVPGVNTTPVAAADSVYAGGGPAGDYNQAPHAPEPVPGAPLGEERQHEIAARLSRVDPMVSGSARDLLTDDEESDGTPAHAAGRNRETDSHSAG